MTQRGDVRTVPGNPSPSMKTLRALDAGSLRGLLPQKSERTQLNQRGYAPEGGARRGVLRRRLVTARPGRLGTPPSRHYDLGARSWLYPIRRQCRGEKRGPGAQNRHGGAPRGERPASWDARRLAIASSTLQITSRFSLISLGFRVLSI